MSGKNLNNIKKEVLGLLKELITTPSFSGEEEESADLIASFLKRYNIPVNRKLNNVWANNRHFDPALPTILLNSHHDTVKPAKGYTLNPFEPVVKEDKLFGLGSNDAGGALVSLLATFIYFYEAHLHHFNLILTATAEEEISGKNGISQLLPQLGEIAFGVVGEPTGMQMAVAEKGLMVLDCRATGKSGHAAREEGENAIYKAIQDINWIRNYQFSEVSDLLGPVKMTVTQVQAVSQHNVVPDVCDFVVDIRANEKYANQEIVELVSKNITSEIKPRSFRLNPSSISLAHPIVRRGMELGLSHYGSPTLSDQALMDFPTLKIGPGDSARSHTADEYIFLKEIEKGIDLYIELLRDLKINKN